MILDAIGTEFKRGQLILPEEWRLDKNRPLQWWMPQGDKTLWKFVIKSPCGEILWQKPFDDFVAALKYHHDFLNGARYECPSFDTAVYSAVETVALFLNVGTHVWNCPDGITPINRLPLIFPVGDPQHDPEMWEAVSGSFTASNSTAANWFTGNKAPANVTAADYLVVGGGAGGGSDGGGGGGAGSLKTATGLSVTPGTGYTVTVGAAGIAGTVASPSYGGPGGVSTFSSVSTGQAGGGGGGVGGERNGVSATANGGSGGGGWRSATTTPGNAVAPGNNGGSVTNGIGSGGGGDASAGASASGDGGGATSNSITGSAISYSGGGGGGRVSGGGTVGGTGGTNAGNGGGSSTAATAGTANRGGGGGGGYDSNAGAAGGSGIVGLTYTVNLFINGWFTAFNEPDFNVKQVTH